MGYVGRYIFYSLLWLVGRISVINMYHDDNN